MRDFALFGETTGETRRIRFAVRYNWAAGIRGRATWSMATPPCLNPNGSTEPSTSIPGACSAAHSRLCAGPKELVFVDRQTSRTRFAAFMPAERFATRRTGEANERASSTSRRWEASGS